MIGRSLFDFVPPEHRARVGEHLKAVLAGHETITDENQVVLPNGETRWFAWTNRALLDPEGRVTAIHSVGRDVERRVQAEARLRENEQRYRMLADHSTDMVFQLDRDLVRQYVSPSCRDVLGYEPDELVAARPFGLVHPEDAERVSRLLKSVLTGQGERREVIYRFRHRNGRWIWVEAVLRALRDPETGSPTGIIGAMRDISTRKFVEDQLAKANRRLEALAAQDGLTGLANRRAFDDALSREHKRVKRQKKGLGLAMIDVDWFKPFNDSYGHLAGDECLRRLGKAIADTANRAGDSVARYGGEEFVVLLPDTDELGAALMGERIRDSVARLAIEHRASPLGVVSVSVGIAATEPRAPDGGPDALLRLADRALYEAKSRGRNAVARASGLTGADFAAA
jgi:diguanylate cyclase (GGDEF)-like protein/PAS domain S-box-containing protein